MTISLISGCGVNALLPTTSIAVAASSAPSQLPTPQGNVAAMEARSAGDLRLGGISPVEYPVSGRSPIPVLPIANDPTSAWKATGFSGATDASSLSSLPVLSASAYHVSGSTNTGTCTGAAATNTISCTFQNINDFTVGEGLTLIGAGAAPVVTPILTPPTVTQEGNAIGPHTYCYIVDAVDTLGGITSPSPQTCLANEPVLSLQTAINDLTTNPIGNTENGGPTPTYLWYVSEDSGPFQLVSVAGFTSTTQDVGQRPNSRGGWPVSLPQGVSDISKNEDLFTSVASLRGSSFSLNTTLLSSVVGVEMDHDDTAALQNAINAGVAKGGATIQLGKGEFNIKRPIFHTSPGVYTTSPTAYGWWDIVSYLYIPDYALGHINIQGSGDSTVINTAPDHDASMYLLAAGRIVGLPPDQPVSFADAPKGALSLTLTSSTNANLLSIGSEIQIYGGEYSGTPCMATTGDPGTCHYSELNVVSGISGKVISLAYPLTKPYYNDGSSSFGAIVKSTTRIVALQQMQINTYNPLISEGDVDGLLVNEIHVNGFVSHGLINSGAKRDVTIESSSWGIGAGDAGATWNDTEEFDKCANLVFTDNIVHGYSAPGAEGPGLAARIYATEGTSQVLFTGNTFDGVSLYFQSTTDDQISNNSFDDALISAGLIYGMVGTDNVYGGYDNAAFVSYNSQDNLMVNGNSFSEDATYAPPYIISVGHFDSAAISTNTISYGGSRVLSAIISAGGTVTGNTITMNNAPGSAGVTLIADKSPNTPDAAFQVQSNSLVIVRPGAGIYVPNPGFTETAPMCIQLNTLNGLSNQDIAIANQADMNLSCTNAASSVSSQAFPGTEVAIRSDSEVSDKW
jgi:hypothetical protein